MSRAVNFLSTSCRVHMVAAKAHNPMIKMGTVLDFVLLLYVVVILVKVQKTMWTLYQMKQSIKVHKIYCL